MSSGRPSSTQFEELNFTFRKEGKKYNAMCNICSKTLQNTASARLAAHRNRCVNTEPEKECQDANIEEYLIEDSEHLIPFESISSGDNVFILTDTVQAGTSVSSSTPLEQAAYKRKKTTKAATLSHFVDSIKADEQKEIDKAVAIFFYGCNIPLHTIESPHFKNMIRKLRPSYASLLPKRKQLSNKLLDEAYENCLKEFRYPDHRESVLLIDGWKNTSNNTKTVVTMLHNAKGKRAFLNAWDLSGEGETADKLSDIVYESLDLGKELYNTTFYAVVSDNASTMVRMGKNVEHVLWHSRCNSHIGNLLAKDVTDKKLVENVNMILKEFKNSDLENSIVSKGGKRIKLACETRWCSFRDAFESFLTNLQVIKQIITDGKPKKVRTTITKLVFDDEFVESVRAHKEMLDPICVLINKCQQMDTSLADAAQMWLSFNVKEKFISTMLSKLKERREMALNTIALTAFYLHPFYDKTVINSSQYKQISNFLLKNLSGAGLEDWHHYREKSGLFETLYRKEITKPEIFWSTAKLYHPNLADLALKLLNIPASSAQLERVFSNWSNIHTPLRNRLTFERSKKLMHIYFSLNTKPENLKEFDCDDEEDLL